MVVAYVVTVGDGSAHEISFSSGGEKTKDTRLKPARKPRVDENQFLIAVISAAETPMNGVQWCECVRERVYMWRLLKGGF